MGKLCGGWDEGEEKKCGGEHVFIPCFAPSMHLQFVCYHPCSLGIEMAVTNFGEAVIAHVEAGAGSG